MSKKSKGSVLNMIEHERHRVAASITREQEWEQGEPNSGLARMFVIMLGIHVFVIGGIIVYDFVGGETPAKPVQASGSTPSSRASSSSTAASVSAPLPTVTSTSAPPAPAPAPEPAKPALSVPQEAAVSMPKAIPYTEPAGKPAAAASSKPLQTAHANTSDPIAFPPDTASSSAAGSAAGSPAKVADSPPEPAKASSPQKTRVQADKPKPAADKPASFQPKPVAPPSAMRKALAGDGKPPAAVASKKKDSREESDPPSVKKAAKSSSSSSHQTVKYTVAKGDTVYSLARKYKTTEDAIMKANGIKKASSLGLGKTIVIPSAK